MTALLDLTALKPVVGEYSTGDATTSISDPEILRSVRMRRRQLSRMMTALDRDTAKYRLPVSDYYISRKIDGEFTCLVYRNSEVFTVNPGGTVRYGAAFHREAARLLKAAGINSALLGGELYVQRSDGLRPRVHDVVRVARAPADTAEVDSLAIAIFNIYDLDGEDPSMHYGDAIKKIQAM